MADSHCFAANDNDHVTLETLKRALAEYVKIAGFSSFEAQEAALLRITNEAVRDVLRDELQRLADSYGDHVLVDGVRYRRHAPGKVTIHSLCGPLTVTRWTYRRTGERNGPLCAPMELEAGLVERATPALAYGIARAYGKSHMREHHDDLTAAHRQPPCRSTLERIAKTVGLASRRLVSKVEPILRQSEQLPANAHSIVLGLDRTTVPMEERCDRRDDRRRRTRPYVRARPAPAEVKYRMAYVGTVAICDDNAQPVIVRRYAAGAHEGPDHLVRRMRRDLRRALEQNPHLHVAVVQDGADELRNLVIAAMRAEPLVRKWHRVIDYFHVVERLAAVAKILEPDEHRRSKQLARWKRAILRNDRAIYQVLKRAGAKLDEAWRVNRRFTATERELFSHAGYLRMKAMYMRYATRRKLGLPIGSGITEGACKSMIASRMKRSGQRWRPEGVEAVFAIRSLLESDRLSRFWPHVAREYRATIRAA